MIQIRGVKPLPDDEVTRMHDKIKDIDLDVLTPPPDKKKKSASKKSDKKDGTKKSKDASKKGKNQMPDNIPGFGKY